jgi:hypothetical protein
MGEKKEEKKASNVFIMDKNFAWRPAILETQNGDKATVQVPEYKDEQSMQCDGGRNGKKGESITVDLKHYPHQVLPLQNVDGNGNLLEFADMVKLPYLHEVRFCRWSANDLPVVSKITNDPDFVVT